MAEPTDQTRAKIKWSSAIELAPIPADDLHIQDLGDRVLLTFGQIRMPLLLGPPPPDLEIELRPVMRFVITKNAFSQMVAVLKMAVFHPEGEEVKAE